MLRSINCAKPRARQLLPETIDAPPAGTIVAPPVRGSRATSVNTSASATPKPSNEGAADPVTRRVAPPLRGDQAVAPINSPDCRSFKVIFLYLRLYLLDY